MCKECQSLQNEYLIVTSSKRIMDIIQKIILLFLFFGVFFTPSLSWTLSSYRKLSFVALNIVLKLCLTRKPQSRKSSVAKNVYACSAMLNLLYVTWSPIDQSDIFRQWGFSSKLQHIRTFRGLLLAWSGRNASRKSNNSYGCECQGLIVDYLI